MLKAYSKYAINDYNIANGTLFSLAPKTFSRLCKIKKQNFGCQTNRLLHPPLPHLPSPQRLQQPPFQLLGGQLPLLVWDRQLL